MHSCGFVVGKPVDYATARLPLGDRYIHATGFRFLLIIRYLESSISLTKQDRLCLFLYYSAFPGFRSSAERNYYEILGVPENASRDDIKKAFHAVCTFWNSCLVSGVAMSEFKFNILQLSIYLCYFYMCISAQLYVKSGPTCNLVKKLIYIARFSSSHVIVVAFV